MNNREDYKFIAKLSQSAERYNDMFIACKGFISFPNLDNEERNLFSIAAKNITGPLRSSWRVISSIKEKEKEKDEELAILAKEYREKIENELSDKCFEIIKILDEKLIVNSGTFEGKVFFIKMKADYYRYLCGFKKDNKLKELIDLALKDYQEAFKIAVENLRETEPIRLSLALNFSVFYYEILGDSNKAIKIAKTAFDDAIADLDQLDKANYKDSTLIMQLLKDNVTLWSEDENQDENN